MPPGVEVQPWRKRIFTTDRGFNPHPTWEQLNRTQANKKPYTQNHVVGTWSCVYGLWKVVSGVWVKVWFGLALGSSLG